MAGSYPDPVGPRIEFDKDGSGVVWWDGTSANNISQTVVNQLNNEAGDGGQGTSTFPAGRFVGIIFPVPHDIVGYFTVNDGGWNMQIEWSTDTTTGVDGTWNITKASYIPPGSTGINYRTLVQTPSSTLVAAKGIRFKMMNGNSGSAIRSTHVYGYRNAATGNWLRMWHPSLDQPFSTTPGLADLGNKVRGSGYANLEFRVKNCSNTYVASGITITRDALTDSTPSILVTLDLNFNGGTFGPTASVGALAPGEISMLCIARLNVTVAAVNGLWAPRITAAASTWT